LRSFPSESHGPRFALLPDPNSRLNLLPFIGSSPMPFESAGGAMEPSHPSVDFIVRFLFLD
jgi:hypothetical protein